MASLLAASARTAASSRCLSSSVSARSSTSLPSSQPLSSLPLRQSTPSCRGCSLNSSFHGLRLSKAPYVARTRPRRPSRSRDVAVASAATDALPSLSTLPLCPFINEQGLIDPQVEPGTKATVFAVCDESKKIQYIGFSKDVRNSLRTLFTRRPELCYFYKLANLPELDQTKMLGLKGEWMSEIGFSPRGNTDPVQRSLWEKPVDAGAVSERGKQAAAESKAKEIVAALQARGLKEEMVFDPDLIAQGKVDVLPSKPKTAEELERLRQQEEERAANRRHVVANGPTGQKVEFDLEFELKFKTRGGWMYDVVVTADEKPTKHRVILGQTYSEAAGVPPEEFVERTFAFLLAKKVERHTEGLMMSDQFPINYFAVSEVEQWYDDFRLMFQNDLPGEGAYWRFNRIHDYGGKLDAVAPMIGPNY